MTAALRRLGETTQTEFSWLTTWNTAMALLEEPLAGTLSAKIIFERVLSMGGGKLGTSTEFQDTIILWEIKALAMIVGMLISAPSTGGTWPVRTATAGSPTCRTRSPRRQTPRY